MTSKQELRDRIDEVTRGRAIWRQRFVVADSVIRDLSDELQATRADLAAARARVAELEAAATTPEPRPFQVGDRVRVAHKATFMGEFGRATRSFVGGHTGVIGAVAPDGDLYVDVPAGDLGGHVSPEFCTLIEGEPDDDAEQATADQAAEQVVRIHLADGQVLEVPGALVEIDGEWWVTSLDDDSPRAWLNLERVAVVVVR